MSETKIINDPVFGFIKIPGGLLIDIVNHPTIQRLSRIKQLGSTHSLSTFFRRFSFDERGYIVTVSEGSIHL